MNNNQNKLNPNRRQQWSRVTLAEYVEQRNGVPLGDSNSLQNMLRRSFGAGSFGQFWQYWNPIWGYGLGKFVYSPLRRFLPPAVAVLVTFIVSGFIHDLVTVALRRSSAFLFTHWFFLLGAGVVLGRAFKLDFSRQPWPVRVAINLSYLLICLAIPIVLRTI